MEEQVTKKEPEVDQKESEKPAKIQLTVIFWQLIGTHEVHMNN